MARGDQLARQWIILQALISARRGKSAVDLSHELDCHLRTVYRDLEALQTAGFPIYTHRENDMNLWVLMDTAKRQIPLPLSLTELMGLYFSRNLLKSFKDSVFYESIESLFLKIKAILPLSYIRHLDEINQVFHVAPAPYKQFGKYKKTINHLNQAILNHRYVEITYYAASKREKARRILAPYKIWFFNRTYYVIGYCMLRREIRIFALDRIVELARRDDTFSVDSSVDIEDLMKSSFGVFLGKSEKIQIWFAPHIADYIKETVWHASQKIHANDDGSLLFEMKVAVNDEIKQWIMKWGAGAKVLKPDELRRMIQKEATDLVKRYETGIEE